MAMDEAQKLAMGARIRKARVRSGVKQQQAADALHVGLRRYQAIQKKGTENGEQIRVLAKLFKVDPDWIWDEGKEKLPTVLNGRIQTQLNRIEGMLEEIHGQVLEQPEAERAARASTAAGRQSRQAQPRPSGRRASKARKAREAGA